MSKINSILSLENHPFYIGLVEPNKNYEIPVSMPFNLKIDEKYKIPRLTMTEEIRSTLNQAYSYGSMCSTPLGESSLASSRMEEYINLLLAKFEGNIKGIKLLEIGCGNGELLNQLRLLGADVIGLEIGPQADIVKNRYGIDVIRTPLEENYYENEFDCICSYGVLEHIENLDLFFQSSLRALRETGLFFHSVPNAQLGFDNYELNHLLHEHINYFTPSNGVKLLIQFGFSGCQSFLSKKKNELILCGVKESPAHNKYFAENDEFTPLLNYGKLAILKFESKLTKLRDMLSKDISLGFYAGGYELAFHLDNKNIRFFDGDSYKHGKSWLFGMSEIESPELLVSQPVDKVVVCRSHYFDNIKDYLLKIGINDESIVNIDLL